LVKRASKFIIFEAVVHTPCFPSKALKNRRFLLNRLFFFVQIHEVQRKRQPFSKVIGFEKSPQNLREKKGGNR
jgi:hypothetical protein